MINIDGVLKYDNLAGKWIVFLEDGGWYAMDYEVRNRICFPYYSFDYILWVSKNIKNGVISYEENKLETFILTNE